MTVAKAIELAFADVMRTFSDVGAGTIIRAWQTLSDEQVIAMEGQRLFPMIDVRCSPPATEDQVTRFSDVMVLCGTYIEDDKNHAGVAALYQSAQVSLDALHDQFMDGCTGDAYDLFVARMAELYDTFILGGFSYSGSEPPYEEGGVNFIGLMMRVHYTTTGTPT